MPRPLLPPRGIFVPTMMIYNREIPPKVVYTWIQLRGFPGLPVLIGLAVLNGYENFIKRLKELTGLQQPDDWEPSWSPDGEWLLYSSARTIVIFVIWVNGSEIYRQ